MDKTLHKNVSKQFSHPQHHNNRYIYNDLLQHDWMPDEKILADAAKDLMAPRPEAISNILLLSRSL